MDGGDCNGAIAPGAFSTLSPSRFVCFTYPNPESHPYGDSLRVAVLDSPIPQPQPQPQPRTAALLVPVSRESDWIFSTESGHLQLLLSLSVANPPPSRLVLVGNPPSTLAPYSMTTYSRPESGELDSSRFCDAVRPLLLALCPKAAFSKGSSSLPEILFVSYDDGVSRRVLMGAFLGPISGEMLVEDVEMASGELRRRLRFKRMPNLIQSQVRILPDHPSQGGLQLLRPDLDSSLAQPYLPPMVAALSTIADFLDKKTQSGSAPRALCVGVGGGELLMFLRSKLGFCVLGVEIDPVVMDVAKRYFGLVEDDLLHVRQADGIAFLKEFSTCTLIDNGGVVGYDVIMIDVDAGDAIDGVGAPPLEFLEEEFLVAARASLQKQGILAINVIPHYKRFYEESVATLRKIFHQLYEINVGDDGKHYVLIATVSPAASPAVEEEGGRWINLLKQSNGEVSFFLDSIKKL